jgi:hypothetical protein
MATFAVFMVLGGGAYAATALPRNSVGTKQIKTHAVTLSKISNNTQRALRGHNGLRGHDGSNGRDGSAVAYVHVSKSGTFDHAKNVSHVSADTQVPGGGGYCLTVTVPVSNVATALDFTPYVTGYISFDLASEDVGGYISQELQNGGCPAGTNALAFNIDPGTGKYAPRGFWAEFN